MNRNIVETVMGMVVLITAGFFISFAYQNSGMNTEGGHRFLAKFDRADGVLVGSDVRMAGVKIGTVVAMSIDPKSYLAEIKMSVDKAIPLPKDTSAEIVSSGLLGDKYISLVPGGDEELLGDESTIVNTQSSISLESMIGQLIFSGKKDDPDASASPAPSP